MASMLAMTRPFRVPKGPLVAAFAAAGMLVGGASAPAADGYRPPRRDLGFTVYTNQPAGRQLSGQHSPASTPALSPAEAQSRFTTPPGFEVRLFASEPEVVNPVAMTWDERGRLWVVELYEYPLGAAEGQKPRDRVKILEDVDADGRADKVHVWADGLNLATGILLGHGGAYIGQAPHLLFLRDTDGDDRADRTEIVQTGFGLEDRHELLNGFTWGPDGWMYMTHGVFTRSTVRSPGDAAAEPVLLTAGVARWQARPGGKFEVFAEGTSNPWGVDFDRAGNAYVSACVIEHLFHLAAGGIYDRQAGSAPHPYAYATLPAINDHQHHMAAYAGVQVYQGDQFPADNLGSVLQGNIHDNAIHQDVLKPNGATFIASHRRDLVRANDGWFMPVSTQVGPDGAVWIMDWYDRYPCYQNANADPGGVDREHGRIWRVVHTGDQPGRAVPSRPDRAMNLAALPTADLIPLLAHPNAWHRRQAQRLISERRDVPAVAGGDTALHQLFRNGSTPDARIAAFWTLHSAGLLDEAALDRAAADPDPIVRAWVARFSGERESRSEAVVTRLEKLARDPDARVRLEVATAARQWVSGSLTVNTPPRVAVADAAVARVLAALAAPAVADPVVTFLYWMALEPLAARDPVAAFRSHLQPGAGTAETFTSTVLHHLARRTMDLRSGPALRAVLQELATRAAATPPTALAACLQGFIDGQRGSGLEATDEFRGVARQLAAHSDAQVARLARELGTLWGDPAALQATLTRAADSTVPLEERLAAVRAVRSLRSESVRDALLDLVAGNSPEKLQVAALDALGEVGGGEVAPLLLRRWTQLSPSARAAAAGAMASRKAWALPLLAEVRAGRISASDLSPAVVRNLVNHRDAEVKDQARAAIGRFRESGADKAALVAAKRQVALTGEPDLKAGQAAAAKACLVCHRLHGEGQLVGPDLTGVGRSSLDALLWNIIDPNQVIGAGYEQVEIETRDDRVVAGRLMESTDTRVRLLLLGGKEEIIPRAQIVGQRTLESSVMPEGLEQLPDAEFRDMIWYILAPPQEGPLTPAKREALLGGQRAAVEDTEPAEGARPDREAASLWRPEWRLDVPDFEGTPTRMVEFAGARNVLLTHPFSTERPAALVRLLEVPAQGRSRLRFKAAAHDQGDWELRVLVADREVARRVIEPANPRWIPIEVDLTPWKGQTIPLRLENRANGWSWEFGYWADLAIDHEPLTASAHATR